MRVSRAPVIAFGYLLIASGFLFLWRGYTMDTREQEVIAMMKSGDDDACMRELQAWIKEPGAPNKAKAYKWAAHMCAKKGNHSAAKAYDTLAKGSQ